MLAVSTAQQEQICIWRWDPIIHSICISEGFLQTSSHLVLLDWMSVVHWNMSHAPGAHLVVFLLQEPNWCYDVVLWCDAPSSEALNAMLDGVLGSLIW